MIKDQEQIKRTAKLSGFLYQNIQKAKHILMGYKIQSLKNTISYQISYMADWFFSDSGCVSHHLLPMSFHRTFTCLYRIYHNCKFLCGLLNVCFFQQTLNSRRTDSFVHSCYLEGSRIPGTEFYSIRVYQCMNQYELVKSIN